MMWKWGDGDKMEGQGIRGLGFWVWNGEIRMEEIKWLGFA